MQAWMHRAPLLVCASALALVTACSGGDEGPPDLGPVTDTGVETPDGGTNPLDSGIVPDSGEAEPDAGAPTDSGEEADAGQTLDPSISVGLSVQVAEGVVTVMQDTFADVTATFGPGTRTAVANTRSYEWALSGGVQLTVWFANTNLDGDDGAPNDVDGTDRVLWVAVQGGFTGTTGEGVGMGATRAEVETAYGTAEAESAIANPSGTLLQYYTTGLLVALDDQGMVRTLTVHRAYGAAPDGTIDVDDARLRFGGTDIEGQDGLQTGTNRSRVQNLFGPPDAQGTLRVSGQDLDTWSYGFIGMEFFFLDGRETVLFMSVHAPFFGKTTGNTGVGSTRTEMETFLSGIGYDGGTASSGNANFICYEGPRDVGVTYNASGEVTSITMPLLACP